MIWLNIFVFLVTSFIFCSTDLLAFEPAEYFQQKCTSCHTVGQGDDVGPDLKGVTKRREQKWLVKFIQESQSLIESGDPIANQLFVKFKRKKMPDQELSEDEVIELLKYIDGGSVKAPTANIRPALNAAPSEIEDGKNLFTGSVRLKNGGPACLSCHTAGDAGILGGGGLGPDLTHVYTSYNDSGLSKVLRNISFPTMVRLYKGNPLEDEEVYKIKSYLWTIDRAAKVEHGYNKKFLFLGIIGFLLVLGLFDLMWKGRIKKTRRPPRG